MAAFVATTVNGPSTFTAAASFPTYPASVGNDSPWAYHRGEESPSMAATSTAADTSGNARTGVYAGTTGGPRTFWGFDDGAGTTAADSSGTINTGSLVNSPTWTTGKVGSALSFNGTNQYVEGVRAAVKTDASFSVAAWAYLTSKGTFRTVVSQEGSAMSNFWLQYNVNTDRWAFTFTDADNTSAGYFTATDTVVPTVNTWHHLTGTYDSSAQQIKLYVNGALKATSAFTATWNATGVLAVGRGKWGGYNGDFWSGMIDDVRLYQRALSATEVGTLANDQLKLKYDLSEGAGTTTADTSGNGNTATITSATWSTTTAQAGNALTFNGTSDHLTSTSAPLTTSTSFSVAAWVYLTANGAGNKTAVAQDGTNISAFYLQYDKTNDRWAFRMYNSDSTGAAVVNALGTSAPALNTWYHLTGVYDSVADTIKLYVNGSLQTTVTRTSSWNATGGLSLGRGRWSGANSDWFPGTVDTVRAYQRALSAAQVSALYGGTDITDVPMTAGVTGALQGAQQGQASTTAVTFTGSTNAYNNTLVASPGPTSFTIECWFKTTSTDGGLLVGFATAQTGPVVTYDRMIYLDSGNRLTFGTWPGATTKTVRSPGTYNDSAWHHVAGSLGPAGLNLYVDGSLIASDPTTTTAGSYAGYWRWGGSTIAGTWPNQPARDYFTGTMDEVAIYSSQLSDQQIAWHYHANH
jgi:hypothetical protein